MTSVRVSYVTMGFPAGAETFACTDVRVLRSLGVDVRVHAMRHAAPGSTALLEERGLADLPVSASTVRGGLAGCLFACRHPRSAWRLARCVLGTTWRQPRLCATSLLL